jgi:hypothetical protein
LGVTLLDAGHSIVAPKPGPDFGLILGGQRIWIEAVTATPGDAGKPDSVPRFEPNETGISSGYVPYRGSIAKSTGAEVDTTLFHTAESAPLSAVIGSVTTIGTTSHMQDPRHAMGQDFRLIKLVEPPGTLGSRNSTVGVTGPEPGVLRPEPSSLGTAPCSKGVSSRALRHARFQGSAATAHRAG